LFHMGQALPETGSTVIERHGLCRETAALRGFIHKWQGWRSDHGTK